MSAVRHATVEVQVLRGVYVEGKPHAVGAILRCTPIDAAAVVAAGRGELVHEADAAVVRQAVQRDTERALREGGRASHPLRFWRA